MITVQHLSMRLIAGGRPVTILDDVTLEIPSKQTVAVTGPSGSGKSTLLGLMAGLDRPTSGSIMLDGIEITSLSESRMAGFRRAKIGYIFQSFHLIPTLTALENVLVPLELAGNVAARGQAIEVLETVGLGNRIDHYPVQLSGGEQQRVAVARAFACRPPILLADEPTGNLDSHTGEAILSLFRKLSTEGRTIVLVTHDPEIAAVTPRRIEIRDGKIAEKVDLTLAGLDRTARAGSQQAGATP